MDDIRDDGQATFPADGVRLDAVAEGRIPAAELTPEEANLAGIIAAVTGPATGEELSGLSPALAAFARHHAAATASESVTIGASNRRRLGRRATAALAASALVVLASGTAAAAYTGSLPEPLQRLAHVALNAPAPPSSTPESVDSIAAGAPRPSGTTVPSPRPTPTPSLIDPPTPASSAPTPTSSAYPTPDPTATSLPTPSAGSAGNSALGLCRAWTRIGSHANPNSAAVRSLIALAGSQSQITAYCAALGVVATPAPGSNGNKSGGGNGHGKGTGGSVPITSPKPTPTAHPTGHPTRHPRPTVPAPSHWRNNPQPHAGSS